MEGGSLGILSVHSLSVAGKTGFEIRGGRVFHLICRVIVYFLIMEAIVLIVHRAAWSVRLFSITGLLDGL